MTVIHRSPTDWSATELAAGIRRRELSSVEVTLAYLERIDRMNGELGAYITVVADRALAAAATADRASPADRSRPLHGVPIAVKDEGHLAGTPISHGVAAYAGSVSQSTAVYLARLEQAGAVVLGKTNLPEFGHKGVTDNRLAGPSRMPYDLDYNAGGSSGGSAAAVAAHLCAAAQGGDGGGSIRIPACMSGVYGLKPSFGRVPAGDRPDGFSLAMPMVSYGPMTKTVEDAAVFLDVMAGPDPREICCLPGVPNGHYQRALRKDVAKARIAFVPTFGDFPVEEKVAANVAEAVRTLSDAGLAVDEMELDWGVPVQDLARAWKRAAGVSYAAIIKELKAEGIDLLGPRSETLSPSFLGYLDAVQGLGALELHLDNHAKTRVFDALQEVLARYDFVVSPVLSVAGIRNAQAHGDTIGPHEVNGTAVDPLLGWAMTFPVNFTGHPAASIPAGFTPGGLPVGLQIVGRRFADDDVLALSALFEAARPWRGESDGRLAVS